MYDTLLTLHSLSRWIILLVAALGVISSVYGLSQRRATLANQDRALGVIFIILLDIQLALGLVLVGLLPLEQATARVIHPGVMILAVVVAHGARIAQKRQAEAQKLKWQAAYFIAPLALILIGLQFIGR